MNYNTVQGTNSNVDTADHDENIDNCVDELSEEGWEVLSIPMTEETPKVEEATVATTDDVVKQLIEKLTNTQGMENTNTAGLLAYLII